MHAKAGDRWVGSERTPPTHTRHTHIRSIGLNLLSCFLPSEKRSELAMADLNSRIEAAKDEVSAVLRRIRYHSCNFFKYWHHSQVGELVIGTSTRDSLGWPPYCRRGRWLLFLDTRVLHGAAFICFGFSNM